MFARRIFIDIYISMFMALTLLFFALAERYPGRRRLFLVLMYACVGLGILTKGPIAALLPGLVFAVYLVAHRELGRVREMLLPLGTLIVLAIVVPWYAALYQQSGWAPIKSFLFGENLARYVDGVGVNAVRPVWWYLPVVFSDSFPWSLFLFPAAALWFRDRAGARAGDVGFRIRTLLWIWILGIVGFFSLSAGKQDLYIYPIVPALVALAGVVIARALDRPVPETPRLTLVTLIIGGLLVVAGAGFLVLFNSAIAVYALAGSALVGVSAIAGGATAMLLALARASRPRARRRRRRAHRRELDVRAEGVAQLRGLQARSGPRRGARETRRSERLDRDLQRRAAKPRLLPAPPHRRLLRPRARARTAALSAARST